MFEIQRSFYDPRQDNGSWSPSTSGSNFCEEDYQTSYYIGEFINTLSNLAYIYYAFRPPIITLPKPSSNQSYLRTKQSNPSTWDLHTPALISVGVTSFIFHATLHSLPQWLDESSMYLLAASFIYSLLTTTYLRTTDTSKTSSHSTSTSTTKSLPAPLITRQHTRGILILLILTLTTTSYISHATGNLTIHSVAFALLLILSGLKLISLIFTFETTHQQSLLKKIRMFGAIPVTPTQRVLMNSLLRSWMFLNLGFALWLVDCNPGWCAWLRYVRRDVLGGTGLGYLTELHGWWHFFTARAAGEYIVLVRVLTTVTTEEEVGHAVGKKR